VSFYVGVISSDQAVGAFQIHVNASSAGRAASLTLNHSNVAASAGGSSASSSSAHAGISGKTIGITGATWLVQRFTRAELDGELDWWDVAGMAMLGGVGFTVSLLIGELAFGAGSAQDHQAKLGVLLGSSVAALLGAGLLRVRDRHYRRLLESDS